MSIGDLYRTLRADLIDYLHFALRVDEDAEDILHDVFLHLLLIDRIEPVQDMVAYLYQSVRNRVIDNSRKHTEESMPQITIDSEDDTFSRDLAELLADDTTSPDRFLQRKEIRHAYESALSELPQEQRDVWLATEEEGKSFKELAAATSLPLNTLLSRKHYATQHLRKKLRKYL